MSRLTRRGFLAASTASVMGQEPAVRPWNLLMITNDQHRADSLGCMGHPVVRTPNLDALAAQGVRFTNHFVQAPQCVPWRASLATGRYPHVHRTPSNAYVLPEGEETLARILNRAGYETAATGEMPFAPRSYTGGFGRILGNNESYDEFLATRGWHGPGMTAERRALFDRQSALSKEQFQAAAAPWPAELDESFFFAERACEFLKARRERPFFLHVNFRRPHHPFDPPAPYDRMYDGAKFPASHRREGEFVNKPPQQQQALRNSVGFDLRTMTSAALDRVKSFYYGMITLNDDAIGRILAELDREGLSENTIVVFNADHGEMLGDHGLLFKGAYMYDEVLRTPLIIRAPGKMEAGRTISSLAEEIDVLPTLLALLGVPVPPGVQGADLLAAGRRKTAVFAEFPTIKMVRTAEWKLVHYPGQKYGELYDLRMDPHELENLWADPKQSGIRAEMTALLADWLVRSQDSKLAPVRDPAEK